MNSKSESGGSSGTKGSSECTILEKGLPAVKVSVKIPVVKPPKGGK